ncbi:MAG: hypothetical protein HXY30_09145 [Pseudorhodoplanes sp.]|nr:hypothetical protein [Pseudorhodoplanes sp.]
MTPAVIVASSRPHSGKTLLARVLAENFILGGKRPLIYDIDAGDRGLSRLYPNEVLPLELARVPDQMALFDALVSAGPRPRIVDLANRSLQKFVDLSLECDFCAEARASAIEPIVFFIAAPEQEAFEEALVLRQRLGACRFVLVENRQLGDIRAAIRQSGEYRALTENGARIVMPALDHALMEVVDEWDVGLGAFMRDPTLKVPLEMRDDIRSWLVKVLTDIYRVLDAIDRSANLNLARG